MQIRPTTTHLFCTMLLTGLILTGCNAPPATAHHHLKTPGVQNQALAPDFELQNHDGQSVRLSSLRGQWVLLYFYPLVDTPSCACKATEFTGLIRKIDQIKALPLAISVDMPDMVDVYRSKYKLPFTLLGDEDAKVTRMYGAWKGNAQNGTTQRTAILINPQGQIVHKQAVNTAKGTIKSLQALRNRYP